MPLELALHPMLAKQLRQIVTKLEWGEMALFSTVSMQFVTIS
jgi:hypothetical protein